MNTYQKALTLFFFSMFHQSFLDIFKMGEEEWFIQPLSHAVRHGGNYFPQ